MPRLAHHVFFTLEDSTDGNITTLIKACQTYLTGHEGVAEFSVGRRVPDLNRPVNAHYDVSLHVVFDDRAAHDAYQIAPRHLEFIAEQKTTWKQVQVFDSDLES